MLSNNTFLETRIQRLLDGLIFVQRMLKMSRVYTLAEVLSKIFVKKNEGKLGSLWFDKLTIWRQHILLDILCDHCLHDLHLASVDL